MEISPLQLVSEWNTNEAVQTIISAPGPAVKRERMLVQWCQRGIQRT